MRTSLLTLCGACFNYEGYDRTYLCYVLRNGNKNHIYEIQKMIELLYCLG